MASLAEAPAAVAAAVEEFEVASVFLDMREKKKKILWDEMREQVLVSLMSRRVNEFFLRKEGKERKRKERDGTKEGRERKGDGTLTEEYKG